MMSTRERILSRLRDQVQRGEVIVGAGAGTGLSAKCVAAGGADLIIIYNSGRFRMAGRGSLAGMMPYGDANAIVVDMASEVLPVVDHSPPMVPIRFSPSVTMTGLWKRSHDLSRNCSDSSFARCR